MKNIFYISVIGLGLLMGSCADFLDRQPLSDLSVATYWKSEQDLKTWNAAMYDGLQSTLRTNWFDWGEVRAGGYAARGTGYDINLLGNSLTSSSGSTSWSNLYNTIYRANAAIKNIPLSGLGSTVTNPYIGQAYTMRALMYFYAIRVWGDVPMITEPMEDVATQQIYYSRSSISDIKNLMLSDIEKALTAFGPSSDLTTASKFYLNRGAALALKMDILMWFKDYDNALVVGNDLLTNYKYALAPHSNYIGQFLDPTTSNEMIFNLSWSYEEDGNGFGYAQRIASGSNTIMYHPSEAIFRTLVERKKEDIRTIAIMDTLWLSTFINPTEMTTETYASAYAGTYGNAAGFQIKCPKFVPYLATANSGKGGYAYANNGEDNTKMPIYRLADILLLKAEALTLKTTPDLAGAIKIVNDIRTRAGYTKLANIVDYPTSDTILNLILDERRIELWAEGKIWFDLVRNDKVKEYLDPIYKAADPLSAGFVIGVEKPSPDFVGGYGRMLWPLNQDVFKKNPEMKGKQNQPYDE
ncbi:MAG TPA: RagB/SusD family nutrient uptake outer membrane protein [Bacteroidales bacterium]|nr:RagB/SusD family nutrient uptake outer membrane protein [Bacteroidales bacterium]